jgi:hypothetical protein
MGYCAETAVAGTTGPHDKEGGSPLRKTFPDIGTFGLLTDRVKPAFFEYIPDTFIFRPGRKPASQPGGFLIVRCALLVIQIFTSCEDLLV